MKKFITLMLVLMLSLTVLSGTAFSLKEDFQLSSFNKDIYVCSASKDITDIITITNTGDVTSSYHGYLQGNDANKATLVMEQVITLEPRESKQLFLYTETAPAKDDKLNFEVVIESDLGTQRVLERNVYVRNCQNIAVNLKDAQKQVSPCEATDFRLKLTNTGNYAETYNLYSKYATFSANSVVLVPGDSVEVAAFLQFACDVYGTQVVWIDIEAERSGYVAEVPLQLIINPEYDFGVTTNDVYNVCLDAESKAAITIKNGAEFDNVYSVDIDGPRWIKPEFRKVGVNASTEADMNIIFEPSSEGTYNATLILESELGKLALEKNFTVLVSKCQDIVLELQEEDEICAQTTRVYDVLIKNNGSQKADVNLNVEGADFAALSRETIEVEDEEVVNLVLNPADAEKGSYDITVTADVNGIAQSKTITVDLMDESKCRELEFVHSSTIVINSSEQVLSLPVINNGVMAETYDLNLDAPEWVELEQDWLELQPGAQGNIDIHINPAEAGSFKITLQAVGEHGKSFSNVFTLQVGKNNIIEFFKLYLLYVIIGLGVILIVSGIVKLVSKRAGNVSGDKPEIKEADAVPTSTKSKSEKKSSKTK